MSGEPPALALRPLWRSSLHSQAADRLREMIIHGVLPPDEALNESTLCSTLGISRTPLREALKVLAVEGLVLLRPHRSATVAPMRPDEIGKLFEVMSGIERMAAELAATRVTDREISRLHRLQIRMEKHYEAGELKEYFRVNHQIHMLIVACAKNEILTATHTWLMARVARARYLALRTPNRWDEAVDEHRAVLAALERRDARSAGEFLARHVSRTGAVVNEISTTTMPPKPQAKTSHT